MTYLERHIPADVPLHRGVVGAMGLNRVPSTEKPYVYRGSKTAAAVLAREAVRRAAKAERKAKAQALALAAQVKREREVEAARVKYAERQARAKRVIEEKQAREVQPRRLIDISDESTWLAPVIPLFKTTEFPETPARAGKPKPPKPKVRFTHVHVAPADIEALLNDDD